MPGESFSATCSVRPRKQHGDDLIRTLPIDRQTLSFQVGSDPHLYVSRAVRCFAMRAGDRAVRLAALHGERATWIQPVDSVDRRSDSSEVAGVTRQPYASTDRRKMLDERGVSCPERRCEATSRRRSGDDRSRGIGAHDLRTRIHLLNLRERGLPKARIVRDDVSRSPEDDRAVRIEGLATVADEIAFVTIARAVGESGLGATNSVSSTTTSFSTVGSATPIVRAASSGVK